MPRLGYDYRCAMSRAARVTDSELLRAVLSSTNVRVAAFDRSGQFLLDADPNPRLPTDEGAPIGGNFLELYGDLPGVPDAVRRVFAGETVPLTRTLRGVTYASTYFPRRDANGEVDAAIVVASLVPEDVAGESGLAEAQTRERRIFNSNMMGMLYWNESGAITDANDIFLSMIGYTRQELAQGLLDWQALTPPEYRMKDQAALAEIRERGVCTPFEKEYVRKDGRRISILIGGAAWEIGQGAGVSFVVDMSASKQHERERIAAESRLRRVVEAAPIVLWSVDTEGKFTLSQGRGLQVLGLAPNQVLGQSAYEIYAAFPEIEVGIRRCLAGEEFIEGVEVGELLFDTLFAPLRDAGGAVTGVLGVSIDVTERRRAEQQQQLLQAQLLQMQKLESLGLLAGGIAHDFNNILTAILGGASTALLTIPVENPAHGDLEIVIGAAHRAASLTRQMLAYSGKAMVEIRRLNLSTHVREITTLLETTIPKKVQLRLELQPDLPAIEADVAQVQQVVMNLVINAAEAIGDQQGTVLVATGVQFIDASYAAPLFASEGLTPGDYVFLEVHDTGSGMDEATVSRIFDPFFSTKFSGRGLGLAAVLGIVRAHRGAIKVYSNLGHGTTFKVFFPASSGAAELPVARATHDYRGTGLVLVIDDDAGVRASARAMLEYFGFSVIDAPDGQAGAELFAARASEIALVIVDMTMPKMGGEETFRAIRGVRTDVPVILTSGYNEVEATRRFTGKGLAGFLEKPFTPALLATKLAAILPRKPPPGR